MSGARRWRVLLCAAMVLAAACGKHADDSIAYGGVAEAAQASVAADASTAQSTLAYEHHVGMRLPAGEIGSRLAATRTACEQSRFGECVVLNVQQQGGEHPSATLGMRIVPAGVEPMIGFASEGADVGHRSTRAEDLAVVVRDNDLALARLRKERERLQEFHARRDLTVADMIALSQRLAETQAQLEAAENAGATHRRRIDTQLLTLSFQPPSGQSNRNDIVVALRESGSILASGVAWTIRGLAFLLPLLVLAGGAFMLFRRWRRRRKAGAEGM